MSKLDKNYLCLSTAERHISRPPTSVNGKERFFMNRDSMNIINLTSSKSTHSWIPRSKIKGMVYILD